MTNKFKIEIEAALVEALENKRLLLFKIKELRKKLKDINRTIYSTNSRSRKKQTEALVRYNNNKRKIVV